MNVKSVPIDHKQNVHERLHEESKARLDRRHRRQKEMISNSKSQASSFRASQGSLDYLDRKLTWIKLDRGADVDCLSDNDSGSAEYGRVEEMSTRASTAASPIVHSAINTSDSQPVQPSVVPSPNVNCAVKHDPIPTPSPRPRRSRIAWGTHFQSIINEIP